ncbi:MAG: acetyl-CoA carboxylase biotin carboxyl carrier protein, partial [Candidatus Krumholzibacteria bacterium]|nr:acetyl-CoA carboxylase biotin carboxyl carrier protein [Candidatus Krumholzibacteria bacterium]
KRQIANGATGVEEKIEVSTGPLVTSPSATPEMMESREVFTGAEIGLKQIVSPMVGTFYMASNPQAEPFVHEGKRVEIGEILCTIEAMKLMNEIESEMSGIVRKVLVKDAQPVEYGQPLFLVESA